jgi:competence protein ComEA
METHRRLVFWLMMLLTAFALFMKGRATSKEEVSAAFVHFGSKTITVRFEGNVVNPGTYEYPNDCDLKTVMKMTLPEWRPERSDKKLLQRVIRDGDVVKLIGGSGQHVEITLKRMMAREMMVLGIPLDPNRMGIDDWQCLPGIGPALALRIIRDRQINGDFCSPEDLERVSGIGKNKLNQLVKYFEKSVTNCK